MSDSGVDRAESRRRHWPPQEQQAAQGPEEEPRGRAHGSDDSKKKCNKKGTAAVSMVQSCGFIWSNIPSIAVE